MSTKQAQILNLNTNEITPVTNAGWLLRHTAQVTKLTIWRHGHGYGGHLVAHLNDNREYHIDFASHTIMATFVGRRVFTHIECEVLGENGKH